MNHDSRVRVLLTFVTVLALAAIASVLYDSGAAANRYEFVEPAQRLLGGLGFGATTNLEECPFSFDPRLSCRCFADLSPIPGGHWFCSRHACSVFYFPALSDSVVRFQISELDLPPERSHAPNH